MKTKTRSSPKQSVPMCEVAVNRCFGGFGLSHAAIMAYAERKGLKLHAYISKRKEDGHLDFNKYQPYNGESEILCVHYSTMLLNADGTLPEKGYFSTHDFARDDADLIAVIKEMGAKANGFGAKIQITKIPADVDWEISEYDGSEHIAEKHRTW